jgi:hypothetical protein
MLKKKLSDKDCSRIISRSINDWKDIARGKKAEDPSRIESMINRLEKYEIKKLKEGKKKND